MNQINSAQGSNDYLKACSSTRWAKNLFILVILLSLLAHLGTYIIVGHTKLLEMPEDPDSAKIDTIKQIEKARDIALPLAQSLGLVAAVLLTMTMKFAVGISLAGRLGGAGGFVSGFFWSLLLLAGFVPWQNIVPNCMVFGCISNLQTMNISLHSIGIGSETDPDTNALVLHYIRFVAYPATMLLVALVIQFKFASGYSKLATTTNDASRVNKRI